MREAVKLEQMVAEYNVQIARLKDRLLEMERNQEAGEESVEVGRPDLKDSMQFSQIETNLRNNTGTRRIDAKNPGFSENFLKV